MNERIIHPINQTNLFGFKNYFNLISNLFNKGALPNIVLLSGMKGLGKSTFIYHFINYILSKEENNKYSIHDFSINTNNYSYKLICNNTHPNYYGINNTFEEKNTKVNEVRNLLVFLSKTSFLKNLKIVFIDNAENLNLSSSNALLKAIEEPSLNTFFFIVHNNSYKISETLKSRCVEFKVFMNEEIKKDIFLNIIKLYDVEFNSNEILNNLHFDTHGNLLKYYLMLKNNKIEHENNILQCLFYFIDKCKNEKNHESLSFLSILIQKFYNNLFYIQNNLSKSNFYNFNKIINNLHNMKKYNLDVKNTLLVIENILKHETR